MCLAILGCVTMLDCGNACVETLMQLAIRIWVAISGYVATLQCVATIRCVATYNFIQFSLQSELDSYIFQLYDIDSNGTIEFEVILQYEGLLLD